MAKAMRLRVVILVTLVGLFIAGLVVALANPDARQLLQHPHEMGQVVREWAGGHRFYAELVVVGLYVLMTLIALPVWWINVLAGFSFGFVGGSIRCAIAAGIAAAVTCQIWHWLAFDVADHTVLERVKVLRSLKQYASDGGFMVVLLTRLAHLVPFGLSNYIFGMLGVRWPAAFVGTVIGNIPSIAFYVSLGAGGDWKSHPVFVGAVAVLAVGGVIVSAVVFAKHHKQHVAAEKK
jgi:uncharacterized membrane protein YdjX (TVP38/TMEM64 family)